MTSQPSTQNLANQFGRRVALHLDHGTHQLPYDISERLRAARTRALSSRRLAASEIQTATALESLGDGTARLHFSDKARNTYNMIMSFIPLVCLLVGLMVLHEFHDDQSAHELAEIDSALLVDDLPPQAYADPAFLDFLKNQPSSKE